MDVLFSNWEDTIQYSPYIVIVQCTKAPESHRLINGIMSDNPLRLGTSGGTTLSVVELVAILKAEPGRLAVGEVAPTLKPGNFLTLWSEYRPCQGDDYLLFASEFRNTNCYAVSDYRVVPLGHSFDANLLSGKSLDEQVKFMLQYRLNNLKRELQKGADEKDRLEHGVCAPANADTNPPSAVLKIAP
jgi:hypothetical protein